MEDPRELLASVKLGNHIIDFYRDHETGGIQLCDGEHCAALPVAGAQQAVELLDVLGGLGDKTEYPVDEEDEEDLVIQALENKEEDLQSGE